MHTEWRDNFVAGMQPKTDREDTFYALDRPRTIRDSHEGRNRFTGAGLHVAASV